jgi:hypothetical protein
MYLAPVREAADRWVFPHWRRPTENVGPPSEDALVQA